MSHNALKKILSGTQGFLGKGEILRHLSSGVQQHSTHWREASDWKQGDIQKAKMLEKLKLLKTRTAGSSLHPAPSVT